MRKGIIMADKYQGCFGSRIKASQLRNWVKKNIEQNVTRQENGIPRCTLNVWGLPGFGKTSIIKDLSRDKILFNGKEQNIRVIDIPLAQIEEMGDVLGFPIEEIEMANGNGNVWIKAVDSLIASHLKEGYVNTGNQRTIYAPPAWVPVEEVPGILLFDDGNRASQRILKGLMQLVQDYRTISWEIPAGWTICFTGNPDNRYNQVTSMDTAQLTRMKHVTLEADAKEWAVWATNQGIDKRGINFVLRYPEMMIGKQRTNLRSLTEFFHSLAGFHNLADKREFEECLVEANASLDEETVAALSAFLVRDSELVLEPEIILENPKETEKNMKDLMGRAEPRIDIVSVTMDRLIAHLLSKNYEMKDGHVENFQKFMLNKTIPQDLVYATMSSIANSEFRYARKFISGKEMLALVMDLYKKD